MKWQFDYIDAGYEGRLRGYCRYHNCQELVHVEPVPTAWMVTVQHGDNEEAVRTFTYQELVEGCSSIVDWVDSVHTYLRQGMPV